MIFEVVSTVLMGSISLKAYLSKNGEGNDSKKLQKLFTLSGLNVKDGNKTYTTQLIKKKNYEWGVEYCYRIPQGRCHDDYLSKLKIFEDGLNSRITKTEFKHLKKIKFDKYLINNIKNIQLKQLKNQKEIEMIYDGLLKIRVYNNPMTTKYLIDRSTLDELKGWEVPVGIERNGELVKLDFDKLAHIIIGGTTDFGKSNILKVFITTLIHQKPNEVTFTLIDLKGGLSFSRYKNVKQVETVAKNSEEAFVALKSVQDRMNRIMSYLEINGFEDVKEAKMKDRHFIIIDEAAELSEDKESQEILKDIARRGRASGFRLLYATQYPTKETVSSQVKRNCIARICFVLDTEIASRAVLDEGGAEKLPLIQGRAIFKGYNKKIVQTPLIENEDINNLIKPHIVKKEVKNSDTKTFESETRSNTLVIEKTGLS